MIQVKFIILSIYITEIRKIRNQFIFEQISKKWSEKSRKGSESRKNVKGENSVMLEFKAELITKSRSWFLCVYVVRDRNTNRKQNQ